MISRHHTSLITIGALLIINIIIPCCAHQTDPSTVTQPKFGDRIGKLKRNFHKNVELPLQQHVVSSRTSTTATTSTSTTTTTTTTEEPQLEDEMQANEISRHDEYTDLEDHGKFQILNHGEMHDHQQLHVGMENRMNIQNARLEMLTDFFDVPASPTVAVPRSLNLTRPIGVILAARPSNSTFRMPPPQSTIRAEPWAIPVLAFSILTMLSMASFEIFVLCKTRRHAPNRRHLFLGQMLLLGLFACAGLAALLSTRPTSLSCATIRFGVGVSYTVVFAALLVKCVFLISLNGGVYLPAPYQGLLLLFAILIQVTVGVQWLMTTPPHANYARSDALTLNLVERNNITAPHASATHQKIFTAADSFTAVPLLCRPSFVDLLTSLIYPAALIATVTVLAVKSRGIRDNYREATYIGLAVAGTIPIWIGWILCGLAVHERNKDGCLAVGLLATSAVIFLVMFMPKGRQLAAMGREDMYTEERDDRFSASSRAGSGYSPSFFHFKPIKYGQMSGKSQGPIEGSKHQQAVTTLGQDYALVVPISYYTPPPMHHYSSHHLTPPSPICYYQPPPHYAGLFIQDDANVYTTLEQTMSSNPNVYFQRTHVHPGMIY